MAVKTWRSSLRIGDQLELELAGAGRVWREPWGGRNPRGLTKSAEMFSLRAPPAGGLHADASVCPVLSEAPAEQLELFPLGLLEVKNG